jgi:hypothetical protein
MKSIIIKTFTATATIGLYKAYSNELISIIDFKKILYKAQEQIKKEFDDDKSSEKSWVLLVK